MQMPDVWRGLSSLLSRESSRLFFPEMAPHGKAETTLGSAGLIARATC
jgi:hypothetical protein